MKWLMKKMACDPAFRALHAVHGDEGAGDKAMQWRC